MHRARPSLKAGELGVCASAFSRTPRPPPWLTALSPISSTPTASKAAISLVREIDVAADHTVAGLHPLDGREGESGAFGELALVDIDQGTGGPELGCSYHVLSINMDAIDI